MITADDIRKHEFESLSDDAYSKQSVDEYVEELATQFDDLYKENKEIVRRLTIFAKKIDEYKKNENYMTETLLTAQKTAAQTISGAEDVVAKMIEAAKNEGKNIVASARERSNEIYADRDKVLADAQAEAQNTLDKANEEAKALIDGAKEEIQQTVDEINSGADAIVSEAQQKAEQMIADARMDAKRASADVIANAKKANNEAEAFKREAFEMKKDALLYKEKVEMKAKAAAAGILLKAQADVNRINDDLHSYVDEINNSVNEEYNRYSAIRTLADDTCKAYFEKLGEFSSAIESLRVQAEPAEKKVFNVDDASFVENSEELDAAVAAEDIDAVLKCFGIDSDEMMKATAQIIEEEASKIREQQSANASANDTDVFDDEALDADDVSGLNEDEIHQFENDTEMADGVDAQTVVDDTLEIADDDAELQPEDDFNFDVDFDEFDEFDDKPEQINSADNEDIGEEFNEEAEVFEEANESQDDFSAQHYNDEPDESGKTDNAGDADMFSDDFFDDDWNETGDEQETAGDVFDNGTQPYDDDAREYKPEMIDSDYNSHFITDDVNEEINNDYPVEEKDDMIAGENDDFELDFSMFEVDEEKQQEREEHKSDSSRKKKKKKKK